MNRDILEHLAYEERRLRRDLITHGYKDDGASLFPRSYMEKMRGNGSSYSQGDPGWTQKGNFSQCEPSAIWNNLPREVVDPPALDTSKIQLDTVLGHLF